MKLIYVCASYNGAKEEYIKSLNYSGYVLKKGFIPVNPVAMNHGVFDVKIPNDRKLSQALSKELIKICDEVWVFGNIGGSEVTAIGNSGIPIIYVQDSFTFNNSSETLSVIMREWESLTGCQCNGAIMENVLYYLNKGLSDKLIIEAIKKAAFNNAGWNYVEGILKNWLNSGVTTAEQIKGKKSRPKDKYAAYDLDLFERMLKEKD